MIRIRSKVAGFRRCGMAHPAEWTEYPDKTFTNEQLAQLLAEPMLQVAIEIEAESASRAGDEDRGLEEDNKRLGDSVQILSDRVSQLEMTRDSLQDEINVRDTDIAALKAEIAELSAARAKSEEAAGPKPEKAKK